MIFEGTDMQEKRAELEKTLEEMFEDFMEFDPVWATHFGIHKYDSLMPDGSKAALEERGDLLKSYKRKLQDFDEKDMGRMNIDLQLARDVIELELFDQEEWQIWSKFPEGPRKVGNGLFPLLVRDHPPAETRMRSISNRIARCVEYLEETKERLEDPVRIYCQIAYESAQRFPDFLGQVLEEAEKHLGEDELDQLKNRIEKLEEAFENYESWLDGRMSGAKEEFAIGRDMLERRLKLRGIEMNVDSIMELGQKYLRKGKEDLNHLAQEIDKSKSPAEIKEELKEDHPRSFNEALEKYKREISHARKFVRKRNLASIPEKEELKVQETPHFLRHVTPFAAYFRPAKFHDKQVGIYMVTPPEDDELMKEHSFYSISNTSVHEGYPGHHLQLTAANQNPSLIRLLSRGTEFVEGWAHYCEGLAKELGYDDTPKHKFLQTLDLVWRAARIIVDIRLSSGEMSFDEAVDFLVNQTGMERKGAESEVRRYSYTPGQPLSYLLGKHLIEELREEVEEKLGDKFELKWFHDKMLESGSLPIKYQRKKLEDEIDRKLSG